DENHVQQAQSTPEIQPQVARGAGRAGTIELECQGVIQNAKSLCSVRPNGARGAEQIRSSGGCAVLRFSTRHPSDRSPSVQVQLAGHKKKKGVSNDEEIWVDLRAGSLSAGRNSDGSRAR